MTSKEAKKVYLKNCREFVKKYYPFTNEHTHYYCGIGKKEAADLLMQKLNAYRFAHFAKVLTDIRDYAQAGNYTALEAQAKDVIADLNRLELMSLDVF